MKVAIYVLELTPREQAIAEAFKRGCEIRGDATDILFLASYDAPDYDVAVLIGRSSGRVFRDYLARGRPVIIIEKGFFARKNYERAEIWRNA